MSKTFRLLKRADSYYYYRRVPKHLASEVGKPVIKLSLGTSNLKKASQLRSLKDIEWDEKFRSIEKKLASNEELPCMTRTLALEKVRSFVQKRDEKWAKSLSNDPPYSADQRTEMLIEALEDEQSLMEKDQPDGQRTIWHAYQEITSGIAYKFDHKEISETEFVEIIRRGLLEITRREIARLKDDFAKVSFDNLFRPKSPHSLDTPKSSDMKLGKLCKTYLEQYQTDAKFKGIAQKRIDKVKASLALISELLDADTLVASIDHLQCITFREQLSKVPTNVSKHYPDLSLPDAIEKGMQDGRAVLSYNTQASHLANLNSILRYAQKLGLLQTVPSEGLAPWASKVHASEARRPFTTDELKRIFAAPIYTGCKDDGRGFSKAGPNVIRRARFWVPLICLFSGMRANEVCQLNVADIKSTPTGLQYFDVNDNDNKKLKNATSKRSVPIHPELAQMGLLKFIEQQKKIKSAKLFPELKADKYGYMSHSLADWFTASFLPSVVQKDRKISLHSFRHNFRDALRSIEAPDWVLQELGGWSQSKGVSDNYGSGYTPNQLQPYVEKIAYPGLNLSHLYLAQKFTV